jgi:hypothetical protein
LQNSRRINSHDHHLVTRRANPDRDHLRYCQRNRSTRADAGAGTDSRLVRGRRDLPADPLASYNRPKPWSQSMKRLQSIAIAIAITCLLGCQAIGLTPATNLDQRLAYSFGQVTAVRDAATVALQNHRLGASEAKSVLAVTDNARSVLDASRDALAVGDTKTAEARLALAVSLLAALQTRLNAKEST